MMLFKTRLRQVPFWEQVKIILHAWFWVTFKHRDGGWLFILRLPLFGIYLYSNWPHETCDAYVRRIVLCFWPSIPLEDGGLIHKYQKDWCWF